jgi:hypothetical protein
MLFMPFSFSPHPCDVCKNKVLNSYLLFS